ncbi:biotin/lipoate--protein ligase family protein [Notoacmeibacter sp. MSK16QG-6]|uniref:biotin/lipoate--protein ligase family protein n=1 Tax=Notoacmeibacter sp. MSK16QG-6 TaxID=2957982 RepID=UPI0020A16103|nr:biotin/lipoate--protein ligase family protein [Notoacmeibacter sp. MSK16QG-6]MCP1198682.1 biotin/lipoate--protein ligase family protein [Notoacmeibacter sp. MSK16QG-6]
MSLPDPRFPESFRGRAVSRETAAFEEACRLAKCQKAEPGDIFYSRRHGMASCALLIDADRPVSEAVQILPLAQLVVAESLTNFSATPRPKVVWPFGVCLAGKEVARVAIGGLSGQEDADDYADWLVLGFHIRLSGKFIERLPVAERKNVTALSEQGIDTDRTAVLECLAQTMERRQRQWQEDGFSPIRQAWTAYAADEHDGSATRLDMEGNAMIGTGEGFEQVCLLDMIARQLPLHLAA